MKETPVKHLLDMAAATEWRDWRWQQRNQIQSVADLLEVLPEARSYVAARAPTGGWARLDQELARSFRFAITPYYLSLARPTVCSDQSSSGVVGVDPILAQVLPHPNELADSGYDRLDPLAEERHSPVRGLTHRYPDRVLWYLSHSCAVYCRYCLRKRKVSRADSAPSRTDVDEIFAYIEAHSEIKEVILSGGDPLSLSDDRLDQILTRLKAVSHLSSIRIHSRMPVSLPMRITEDLCEVLRRHYPLTLVTHFNHAAELWPAAGSDSVFQGSSVPRDFSAPSPAAEAVRRLRMAGVTVLNQSVLLKDVNDTARDQEALILALLRAGVIPYYLHRCDEVRGVSHYRVPLQRGLDILNELRGRNPGIALPRYIVDLPDGGGKVALEPDYLIDRTFNEATGELVYRFWNWERKREFVVSDFRDE
ncbi:MAG: 4Fe-4S cluster-binding domain-containing protein [Leptospirales bacterium]|jgi:lysine 2,3-aminomutase